jgi:tetratricopeptide (TPR) repeat protein
MWWFVIPLVALVAAYVVYLIQKPALKRKAAIRRGLEKARAGVARDPNDLPAKLELARVCIELASEPAQAIALLEPIDAAHPTLWPAGGKPAKVLLAEAYVAAGKLDVAIATFQRFVAAIPSYDTGGDKERKWRLETFKVDAEQRMRLLAKGDTHVHAPEQWGDRQE